MEQLYLLELYIDCMKVYAEKDEMEEENRKKQLVFRINFGWHKQLIIKENLIVQNTDTDELITGEKSSWIRSVRSGTAVLFVTHPDTLLTILRNKPLEIEVWNTDENESSDDFKKEIFVGNGKLAWHSHFFEAVKANRDCPRTGQIAPPTLKTIIKVLAECCCKTIGEVKMIIRLSPLGPMVITDFQQNLKLPENFFFKTDKYEGNLFEINITEGLENDLYNSTLRDDPVLGDDVDKRSEICTVLPDENPDDEPCDRHRAHIERDHRIATGKLKMGDIIGPCGNPNCKLAQKVRSFVRNLPAYKSITGGLEIDVKDPSSKKVCGTCSCRNNKWHTEQIQPARDDITCEGCGGKAPQGLTCQEQDAKFFDTGATPPGGSVAYVYPPH